MNRHQRRDSVRAHLSIASANLTVLLREDNEAGLVSLEASNVGLQRLLALVGAAVVDRDADRDGLLARNASLLRFASACKCEIVRLHDKCAESRAKNATHLELLQGEATACTDLAVVLLGHRVDDRAQKARDRARRNGDGLHA